MALVVMIVDDEPMILKVFKGFMGLRSVKPELREGHLESFKLNHLGDEIEFLILNNWDRAVSLVLERKDKSNRVDLIFMDRNGPEGVLGDKAIKDIVTDCAPLSAPDFHYNTTNSLEEIPADILKHVQSGPEKLQTAMGFWAQIERVKKKKESVAVYAECPHSASPFPKTLESEVSTLSARFESSARLPTLGGHEHSPSPSLLTPVRPGTPEVLMGTETEQSGLPFSGEFKEFKSSLEPLNSTVLVLGAPIRFKRQSSEASPGFCCCCWGLHSRPVAASTEADEKPATYGGTV